MIYVDMPVADCSGWGICGRNIIKELYNLTDIKLFSKSKIQTENLMDRYFYNSLKASDKEIADVQNGVLTSVDYPILESVPYGMPYFDLRQLTTINLKGKKRVGYIFYEENILSDYFLNTIKANWDYIVAGSKWCEETLKFHGYNNTSTIIQGVDPFLFHPRNNEKEMFQDKFVIFSGGKFEYRKGQDIVIKAFKVLQEKYKDVLLVNAWFNNSSYIMSMSLSEHIRFQPSSNHYPTMMNQILADNGVDPSGVINLMACYNSSMPSIFKNTDIGLFPNRCEGGTNLVLMEYMACGKPVIASYNSGHRDILRDDNSIKINAMSDLPISFENNVVAIWENPDLDETISHLEWAYHNRDKLKPLGNKAAEDMSQLGWKKITQEFVEVLNN